MGDLGPGGGAGQAGDAGIAEQVEDPRARPVPAFLDQGANAPVQPVPVGRLFGEEGQVAERGETAGEADVAPGEGEILDRATGEAPAAVVILVLRIEHGIGAGEGLGVARRPETLRFWPDHGEAAITLQLAPVAAVQQGVVGPAPRDEGFGRGGKNRRHPR